MKSIKQTFGIFIVALALFGAYSLVCPKKPVDDRVSDNFLAELANEGIFLTESEDTGGKSVLFNTLGNFPSLPSSPQTASGSLSSSVPPPIFGEGVSSAPKYTQSVDDDLDLHIPSDGDDAPVWNENSFQSPQNAPEILEFPVLEVPSFDEVPLLDVPAAIPAESTPMASTEVALMPIISEDSLNSWHLSDVTSGETLESSTVLPPVDSTTMITSDFMEVPQESDQWDFDTYYQRAPTETVNPIVTPPPAESVRPLPQVTEGTMTLASGTTSNNSPVLTDRSVSTEVFSFSDSVPDLPAIDFESTSPVSNFPGYSDFSTPTFETTSSNTTPGIARSSQRREAPDSIVASPVARNPISQNSPRPEVLQKIAQIKNILNDETAEYRLGHQMITTLYMSDLNFAERELVLPIADKCGWAAFFSSRSFDPYEWGRTIKSTDTIQSLATQNGISPELILKINLLEHPSQLTPGKENIKIPKGPFDATIFLDRKEMVITAYGLFACRFRIGIGRPEIISEGVYQIESKFPNPRYLGEFGEIESGDPRNPLGTHWIGLDQEIGIHGTNSPSCLGTSNASVEGFSMDNRDVADVYDMLTSESRITIRR